MTSARQTGHTSEEIGCRATTQPITLMRPPFVVELHETVETALHCLTAGEVLTPKRDAPVLVQDRASRGTGRHLVSPPELDHP